MNLWIYILTAFVCFLSYVRADKSLILEQMVLNDILSGYDKNIRPHGENGTGPVVVEINTYIRSISGLDDVKNVYTVQLTFRQKWHDERCKFSPDHLGYITVADVDKMWIPDLFFANEMTGHSHKLLTPNNFIRIYPDGHVLSSTRVSLELSCPMDLRNFPMDRQTCNIKMASYGYTTKDIVLRWKSTDPVQVSNQLFLTTFTFNRFILENCNSITSTGEYSCIVVDLEFARTLTSYLIQVFIPTMLLVVTSWITFWLHPCSISPRLGIWIGVFLSMVTVTTSVTETSPRASCIKAIDVWLGTCIIFLICVLIEISLVYNAVAKANRDSGVKVLEETDNTMSMDDGIKKKPIHFSVPPLKWLNRYSTQAERIDAGSRILFPVMFGLFNFVYWLTYTSI